MQPARFLIVDDDPTIQRALGRMVRRHGEPVFAATVLEAEGVLCWAGEWCGFVIDVTLPDGSGLDLLQRARQAHPVTPALVLTGRVQAELINRAYDLGAEYLVKPVVGDRLSRFLREARSLHPRAELAARAAPVVGALGAACGLTEAEADVLLRSALGQERAQIAAERGSSEETVRTQTARLLLKTRHGSLAAAVAWVLREVVRGGEPPP